MSCIKSISRIFSVLFINVALLFGAVGMAPAHAQSGATWFVATTGLDSNSCSDASAPCLTIKTALAKAAAGDSIKVATGTYDTRADSVAIYNNITLTGGWDAGFVTESGMSTIDGGGGISIFPGVSAIVDRFTIQNMEAIFGGGGISNEGSLTLNNSIVRNNVANCDGGGIQSTGSGILTINNSVISDNAAGTPGGGGISIVDTTVILNNSTVSGNNSSNPHSVCGGGFEPVGYGTGLEVGGNGSVTLNNSTVSANSGDRTYSTSPFYAIEIVDQNGTVTLNNSTVSRNLDGGIGLTNPYIGGTRGTLIANNSTISNNGGAGVYNNKANPGVVTLRNSIVADNAQDCSGTISSSGYNLIGNTSLRIGSTPLCSYIAGAGDLSNVPAGLGTLTGSPAYVPLLSGSPAIDAGNPAIPGSGGNACLATDQRGMARPQGSACDMGAFEWTGHTISGNAGMAGAVLSYHDSMDVTVTADNSGNYTLRVVDGWNGVVTPSKVGYSFSPASIDYSVAPGPVTSDLTGQDYAATRTGYVISGNAGVPGALLSYIDGTHRTTRADSNGNYAFAVPKNWSGTVTPSNAGTRFVPAKKVYTKVVTDRPAENYTAYIIIPTPAAPANIISDSTPTFQWNRIQGATSYQYQLVRGTKIVYSKVVGAAVCKSSTCSTTPVNVLANGAYKWRVQAMIGNSWKGYSSFKTFTVLVPRSGFWKGDSEFYVTPTGMAISHYTISISVFDCNIYKKLTYNLKLPIVNGNFNYDDGSVYFNGTFISATISKGTLGFRNYFIPDCGYITGGPFPVTDNWSNPSQPRFANSEMFTLAVDTAESDQPLKFFELKRIAQ